MTWSQAARVQRIPALKDAAVSTTADDALSQHVVVTRPDRNLDDVPVRFVSWNYLHVLGIRPDLGRDLQPGDDGSDSPAVAVLTRAYWLSRFGGRADIVGRVMQVNGVTTTVVGVLDRAFAGTQLGVTAPAMFLPLHAAATIGRNSSAATAPRVRTTAADGGLEPEPAWPATRFQVIARLPAGRDRVQAETVARLRSDEWTVVPLTETMLPFNGRADLERFLWVLTSAVALTLTVACVNVGMLLYGDVADRRQELTVRVAIGASSWRVLRLIGVEVAMLVLAAGAAAAAVLAGVDRMFAALALPGAVTVGALRGDVWRIASVWVVLSAGVAIVVAVFPMRWLATRTLSTVQDRAVTPAGTSSRAARLLMAAQTAACLAMTVLAVFFVRVVSHGLRTDLGFDPDGLMQAVIGLAPEQRTIGSLTHLDALVADIQPLPSILAATIGPVPLIAGSDRTVRNLHVDGAPVEVEEPVDMIYASSGYFRTLGQQNVRGRDFQVGDVSDYGRNLVAIVNQAAARLFWHGADPLGHRLVIDEFVFQAGPDQGAGSCRLDGGPTPVCSFPTRPADCRVVGVVPDMVLRRLGETARPVIYVSLAQWQSHREGSFSATGAVSVIVRSRESVPATGRMIADVARRHGMRLESMTSVADTRDAMVRPQRLARALLVLLAGVVLIVMLTGTYAAANMAVRRDQRSNAVRLMLGARPADIVGAGLGRVAWMLASGATAGVLGIAWAGPMVDRFGLGLPLVDPSTIAVVFVGVVAAGLLAAYIPMRRVHDINPVDLLRD
jgi:predicted permease